VYTSYRDAICLVEGIIMPIFGRTSRCTNLTSLIIKQNLCTIPITINSFRTFATTTTKDSTIPKAQLTTNDELTSIVNQFPPQDYAFGYGSGVLRQQSTAANPSMIDIIFAVDNPNTWHEHNLQKHAYHYSYMARLGGVNFITWLQTNFGAKIYFHPFVDINLQLNNDTIQRQIKYGLVSTDDLIQDLLKWDYLYLAGRMHKPIVSIDLKSNDALRNDRADEIEEAQRINLLSAVSASLLLYNNNTIPTSQLYNTIASLSYTGDFRMQTGAEDPNKVKKLVETPGMLDLWDDKYSDTLDKLQKLGLSSVNSSSKGKQLETNLTDMSIRKQLVQHLPPRLRQHSDSIVGSSDNKGSSILREELANIVSPAAKSQSIKGFFTAGVVKSWRYALAKLKKGRIK